MRVEGCGIKIDVNDEGHIRLNDSTLHSVLEKDLLYRRIEIVRDATVLTVSRRTENGVTPYSTLVEPYDGDCQFEATLPADFSPFVADVFGRLPIQESTELPSKTATVDLPSKTRTVELPSKTKTEPRQCRPKSRRPKGLRRLLGEVC
eukprot:Trichotokara_eunicae@DN6371_c3_g1_i3.p1